MIVEFFANYQNNFKDFKIEIKKTVSLRWLIKHILNSSDSRQIRNGSIEKFYNDSIILINGKNVSILNNLDTRINNKDKISIFPIICGG
jgi:molybdopterin converting factor small subunit